MEGEVWAQDNKVQTPVHLNSQPWMVKPLSEGCVNTVVTYGILITPDDT